MHTLCIYAYAYICTCQASLVAQMVKNLPTMQEAWVQSLGQENPLEKGMTTHSRIFAWRIPWTKEPGGLQSMGLQRVGHTEWLTYRTYIHETTAAVKAINITITSKSFLTPLCCVCVLRALTWDLPGGAAVKNPSAKVRDTGDTGLIPRLGRFSGVANGNPLQYSCLKNSKDK